MMLGLWAKFRNWIAFAGATVLLALGIYFAGKGKGKDTQKIKHAEQKAKSAEKVAAIEVAQERAKTETIVETLDTANEVTKTVSNLDNDAVIDKLHNKWSRD